MGTGQSTGGNGLQTLKILKKALDLQYGYAHENLSADMDSVQFKYFDKIIRQLVPFTVHVNQLIQYYTDNKNQTLSDQNYAYLCKSSIVYITMVREGMKTFAPKQQYQRIQLPFSCKNYEVSATIKAKEFIEKLGGVSPTVVAQQILKETNADQYQEKCNRLFGYNKALNEQYTAMKKSRPKEEVNNLCGNYAKNLLGRKV